MKQLYLYSLLFLLTACYNKIKKAPEYQLNQPTEAVAEIMDTEGYELILPIGEQKGVLILFPGYPENPTIIKQEFKIVQPAMKEGIALVLMKFNQRLWLDTREKYRLAASFNQLFVNHKLDSTNVFIGGFSSGGNISFLLANHLAATDNIIQPKGVFLIDSPVDLVGLHEIAQRNIQRNFSPSSIQESTRTIQRFESSLGTPKDNLDNYEWASVYTQKTANLNNVAHLGKMKVRLYTEPDIDWWKENRQNEWEDMNAFHIKNLSEALIKKFGQQIEYLPTQNKGYRADGQRHPHSWSIVDIENLLSWIIGK